MGGKYGRNKMVDKKLSAYDVLSEMCGEDLIVALKSLGEGKYQNANVKLSKMAEALSKLNEKALANSDLSNLTETGKTMIEGYSQDINILKGQISALNEQISGLQGQINAINANSPQGQINNLNTQLAGLQNRFNCHIRESQVHFRKPSC
jgi:predicted  nucleic acid-binding Zn-ribbon protein